MDHDAKLGMNVQTSYWEVRAVAGRLSGWVKWLLGIITVLVIIGIALVVFAYSGFYSVAATRPDNAPVAWFMSTTMDNSVKRHAKGIKVPALDDPKMIQTGFGHYKEMCEMCHGGPGVKPGEIERGLQPEPPELTEAASDWNTRELFWITKNGVRMTGMPAWGVTHPDNVIWSMVSFVRRLPKMTPEQYQTLSRTAPPMKEP